MQHRVRRPIRAVLDIVRSRIGKLVLRMEARNLDLAGQIQRVNARIGDIQEIVIGEEVVQYPRMNQQRSIDFFRIRRLQIAQLGDEIGLQLLW